ncbi:MAG: hypothetical protein ABTD50_10240 [Polyangiaceae bacterium]|jgi:hypothetical protein
MRNPERCDDPALEEVERLLLKAGRAGAPAGSKQRALAAMTGVVAASAISGGQAAAASLVAKSVLVSSKWLAVVSLTGVVAVSGTLVVQHIHGTPVTAGVPARSASTSRAPARVVSVRSPEIPPAPATMFVATPSAPSLAVPSAPASPTVEAAGPVVRATAPAAPSFALELSTLDQARAAVADGEPARALSILGEYSAQFPRGAMGPEAAVLRVEALLSAGDRAAAERVARAFLQNNPTSPYGPRVKSLLGANP